MIWESTFLIIQHGKIGEKVKIRKTNRKKGINNPEWEVVTLRCNAM